MIIIGNYNSIHVEFRKFVLVLLNIHIMWKLKGRNCNLHKFFFYLRIAPSVTSTSQHQIFDEKFDQEPESVRIKMADLAGR